MARPRLLALGLFFIFACDDVEPIIVARCGSDKECGPGKACEEGACVPKDAVSCSSVSGGKAILQPGPPLVEFGQVGPATSFQKVTLRNIGNCTLTIFEAYFEAGDETPFECPNCAESRFPIELFPFRDTELELAFTPNGIGEFHDRLVLLSDDGEYNEIPIPVRARYIGVPVPRAVPDSLDFGYNPVGRTVQRSIQVSNIGEGEAELVITDIHVEPTGTTAFSLEPELTDEVHLLPLHTDNQAFQTINVAYHPHDIGAHHAEVVITTNLQKDNVLRVPIAGTSKTPPKIEVTPDHIDFGPVPIGRSTSLPLTIVNSGGSPLHVRYKWGGAQRTTDLSASPAVVPAVAAGQYTELSVLATATGVGPINGLLIVESDDPNRPSITIPVSADGQDLLGASVLKIDMAYENGDDSAFDDDLRSVDMTLENPFGLVCNKANPNPSNWGSFGSPSWLAFGVVEEPERIVLPNAEQDGTYRVLLSYVEDCAFIPSSLLSGVLGISIDVLIAALVGYPVGVSGSQISDVIDDICFDHESSNATITVYVNGAVVGERTIKLGKKGDTVYALDIVRSGGQFTVR